MLYTDKEVRDTLNLGINGLKRIRSILRQKGLLADRERINSEKLQLIEKIVQKQRETKITYETAINDVLSEEQRQQNLLSILNEDVGSYSIDTFFQVLNQYFENADEVSDKFFDSFTSITDILRQIGDDASVEILVNLQETIINNVNFKFLYQQNRRDENN